MEITKVTKSGTIALFVIHYKGSPFYGMMYEFIEDARESAKDFSARFVEIKKENFESENVYYAGEHPEYGPIYALLSEIMKGKK